VSARFEVRKVADGWQVWDLRTDQAHQQPGMEHTHWWPPTARGRAQEWVDQHKAAPAASPGAGDWAPGAQVHPMRGGYEVRRA
jgi:hypothetical protein